MIIPVGERKIKAKKLRGWEGEEKKVTGDRISGDRKNRGEKFFAHQPIHKQIRPRGTTCRALYGQPRNTPNEKVR